MEFIFKLETTVQAFQSDIQFTSRSLAEGFFFSRKLAQKHIKQLRDKDKLVIVDYVPRPTFGGKPEPVYAWKWERWQKDITPKSNNLSVIQRLELAYERKRNRVKQERDDALQRAKSDEEKESIREGYEERLNEMLSEKMEADKRRRSTKNLSRDLKRKVARVQAGTGRESHLLSCWSHPVI